MNWNQLRYWLFSFGLAFFAQQALASSNLGTPFIHNFPKSAYQAGTQNWAITQDHRKITYFANNAGLLEFDGINWKVYPIDNRTIVRSIDVAADLRWWTRRIWLFSSEYTRNFNVPFPSSFDSCRASKI